MAAKNRNPTGFNIKAVAERTGVSLHTLRAWERRYGIPRPNRNTENRYRLYDEQDIADVLWIKRQVQAGVSPAQASVLLREESRPEWTRRPMLEPLGATQKALYDAFVAQDEPTAQRLLNEAWSAFAPEHVVIEILQPTLRQIGDAWQRNLLSVEQEHFASNLIRQRLDAMIQAQPMPMLTAPRLVAACAPEEQHELGLLTFTLLAKRHGWNVNYLGQRTPLADMARAGRRARFIVISVSTVTGLASLVPLWNAPPSRTPMLFGGELLNQAPSLSGHMPGGFLGGDSVTAIQQLATSIPQLSDWRPSRRLLYAALTLAAYRLQIATATIEHFAEGLSLRGENPRNELRRQLSQPALFLTDAFVAALAFDAPELVERQGIRANDFMPAYQISPHPLHGFLNAYAATLRQVLPNEAHKRVGELYERLVAFIQVGA